jgi:hypothetical protein
MRMLKDDVTDFVSGHDQFDDMTLMCIEYRGGKDKTEEKE